MRELKFRAWNESQNVYCCFNLENIICVGGEENLQMLNDTLIGGVVIEQYTGLKDKNGKEIYEGDIIRYDAIDYKVLWADYYAGFETKRLNSPWNNAGLTLHFLASVGRVIGNIHEKDKLVDFDHVKGGEE